MLLGFSTNGIGDVDPLDALPMLRDLGYRSLAITLDHHTLHPAADDLPARIARWQDALAAAGMACVIETGARHLLDRRVKHEPTLVSADRVGRDRRLAFTRAAIDIAAELNAGCISLWSGVGRDVADDATLLRRLTDGLSTIVEHATARGVTVAFEPEPGMVVDTLARAEQVLAALGRPEALWLTVDVGHLECMGERPCAAVLAPWRGRIANVHVDDMLACRHEHLPLGSGDVDFTAALAALVAAGYRRGLHVELPRQSHCWLDTARRSAAFLSPLLALHPRESPA